MTSAIRNRKGRIVAVGISDDNGNDLGVYNRQGLPARPWGCALPQAQAAPIVARVIATDGTTGR